MRRLPCLAAACLPLLVSAASAAPLPADAGALRALLESSSEPADRKAEAAAALIRTEAGRREAAAVLAEGTDVSALVPLVAALKDPAAPESAGALATPLADLFVRTKIALARQGQGGEFILNPTVVQDLARALSGAPAGALRAALAAAMTPERAEAWVRAVHANVLGNAVAQVELAHRDRLAEIGDPRAPPTPYGFADAGAFAEFAGGLRERFLRLLDEAADPEASGRMANGVLGFDAEIQGALFPRALLSWRGVFRTIFLRQHVDELGADTLIDRLAALPEADREGLYKAFREEAGDRAERWARAAIAADPGSAYRGIAREELRAAVNASPGPEGAWWTAPPAPEPASGPSRALPIAGGAAAIALALVLVKAGHPRRWARPALFTLLAVALAFGAAEGALRLLGVEGGEEREDPFYGLSPDYKLFKRSELETGEEIYETNFNKQSKYDYFNFNYQRFAANKPEGAFRIFTLGESSVYGVPYGDKESFSRRLEGKLRERYPGRTIEVVNCGGAGYETERIRILARELMDYEPDLFIVYTGHNEFLNHFYAPGSADFAEKFTTARIYLNRIRLYALLRRPIVDLKYKLGRAQAGSPPTGGAVPPLVQVLDGSAIRRKYNFLLDAFVRNLTDAVREAQGRGARVILASVGSNQLAPPNSSVHFKALSPEEETAWAKAYAAGVELYRSATAGAPQRPWSTTPEARALLEKALAELERAAALDDSFAMLSFYRGETYARLGRWEKARELLQRCLWDDARPNRAPPALNDALRALARAEGTAFTDAYAALAAGSEGGVLGFSLFADYVHPNLEGHEIIADALAAEIERQGWIR